MLSRVPIRSGRGLLPLGAALALLLAGCGPDLGKVNFQRTTVPAESGGGQGQVPTGPIDDPAVTVSALRTVDPCGLLTPELLGELGTPGEVNASGWDGCSTRITDAGGKHILLSLRLGESISGTRTATGNVEGLPQIENKLDETSCFVTAQTSKEDGLGITAQVDYEGGDPCAPGRTALRKVIQAIHQDPPRLAEAEGSLVGVDPCTGIGDELIAEVLPGEVEQRNANLHTCRWSGSGPEVMLRFRLGYAPDDGTEVDLGGGVTGYQKSLASGGQCAVTWMHRPLDDNQGELAELEYSSYTAQEADGEDSCAKAVDTAKQVLGSLPGA
ncbi:DUF3558 family protein [Amycolatopsis aidingensis]|uniref:DUF3558 family protein n=1 Tax=Amycolatopsis aidingensis TaxID=2842453 RepID=UPI001C0E05FE|nr:DUF3558 family protein [Amycolatopsis aidingensis]